MVRKHYQKQQRFDCSPIAQIENHRSLRGIMGIGDWQDTDGFSYRRIRDTICLIKPETISKINQAIVSGGHDTAPDASATVRADSFVIETNIHYPTESSLIFDGVRKFMPLCVDLAQLIDATDWRQAEHL